jgi:hypothetical protein
MFYIRANSMPLTRREVPSSSVAIRIDQGIVVTLRRRIALLFFGALALAGAYDAVRNLPVMSGCYFYADCPQTTTDVHEAPIESPAAP